MNKKNKFESHALNLGKIVGNLLSIEMGARMAIVKLDERAANHILTQLPLAKAGDWIEVNAFTNSDDLRNTLERYNKRSPVNCRINVTSVVSLRDAIAHGRTFGAGPIKHLRLLKFNRNITDGKVLVELGVIGDGGRKTG